jgi:hypothetical protein
MDPGFVRPYSVIPDLIRNPFYRNETAEDPPEGDGISPATFSRSKWTPGQARGDGGGAGHGPRVFARGDGLPKNAGQSSP